MPCLGLFKIIYFNIDVFSANAILNVFIPLRGHDLGATNTVIGIVMGAYMLTAMLFRPWAGQIIARIGPIKVLRIILLINAMALVLYGFTGLEGYLIARIMQGVCTAFFSMSLQLGIIDALPEKYRSEGVSLFIIFNDSQFIRTINCSWDLARGKYVHICYCYDFYCSNNNLIWL